MSDERTAENGEHRPNACCDYHRHIADGCCHCENQPDSAENDVPCVFCDLDKIAGVEWCADTDGMSIYRFEPLSPVTPGHMLFVSDRHTRDAAHDPMLFGKVAEIAGWWVRSRGLAANIITSVGTAATQTVFHLHVHVVPRIEGDGLALPWAGQTHVIPPAKGDTDG